MISLSHTYTALTAFFFCIWLGLCIFFPKVRKEMLFISIGSGLVGLVFQNAYLTDWWHTYAITGSRLGIEDYLFNFSICGIGAVLYGIVFRKSSPQLTLGQFLKKARQSSSLSVLLAPVVIFLVSFYGIGTNSLWATVTGFAVPILWMWVRRPDLVTRSVLSGILLLCVVCIVYNIVSAVSPDFDALWIFRFSGETIRFLSVPLEDIIGFVLAGMYVGPLYTYVTSSKK